MKKELSYVGVIIADVHFGALSSEELYNQLSKHFLNHLKKMKVLDFVVIAGDLFDAKISLNSDHTKYAFLFLKSLINICISKNAKLRIIKGTESHDNRQLDVLQFLMSSNCDIKIFNHVESEELFPDFNVLYIPEEYMEDKDRYYNEFFNKEYDMIFGHGLMNEVAFVAKMQDSEVTMAKAPIFKSDELLNICKGPIFFGHIHKAQCIKERIYYTGSFSRWCFGEESEKGFMMVVYNPENNNYETEFIENKSAKIYNTMIVDYGSKFFSIEANQQLEYILSLVQTLDVYRLRIIFNIPEDYENPIFVTNLINDTFSKYPDIKVIINNNSREKKKKKEVEDKIQLLMTKYDFIFDKSLSPEDKISKFILLKYNKNITVDKMREYLYNKLQV